MRAARAHSSAGSVNRRSLLALTALSPTGRECQWADYLTRVSHQHLSDRAAEWHFPLDRTCDGSASASSKPKPAYARATTEERSGLRNSKSATVRFARLAVATALWFDGRVGR